MPGCQIKLKSLKSDGVPRSIPIPRSNFKDRRGSVKAYNVAVTKKNMGVRFSERFVKNYAISSNCHLLDCIPDFVI